MKTPLHILHLEDDLNDAELVQSALEADGITSVILRVQTRDDFVSALERGGIDLILSDFDLPAFDGLSAVEIVRTRWSTIPLILVSGSLDEDLAMIRLRSGPQTACPREISPARSGGAPCHAGSRTRDRAASAGSASDRIAEIGIDQPALERSGT